MRIQGECIHYVRENAFLKNILQRSRTRIAIYRPGGSPLACKGRPFYFFVFLLVKPYSDVVVFADETIAPYNVFTQYPTLAGWPDRNAMAPPTLFSGAPRAPPGTVVSTRKINSSRYPDAISRLPANTHAAPVTIRRVRFSFFFLLLLLHTRVNTRARLSVIISARDDHDRGSRG